MNLGKVHIKGKKGRDFEKLFEGEGETLNGVREKDGIRRLNLKKETPPFLISTTPGYV